MYTNPTKLTKMETESILRHKVFLPEFIQAVKHKIKIKGSIASITIPPNQKGKTFDDRYILIKIRETNGKSTA